MITLKLVTALVAATGWQPLPAAPISSKYNWRTSVWTGKQMLVFGRDQVGTTRTNVAAAYDPRSREWRRLAPPAQTSGFMDLSSAWTGKELLVWGQGTRLAYNPATDVWRRLPGSRLLSIHDGFGAVVWTGKEMLGWGGGCCGDAFSDGVAYNPATNVWRALPQAPLPGSQHPVGVWTGKEYVVLSGTHVAAYAAARNEWRRLPPAPFAATLAVPRGGSLDVLAPDGRAAEYARGRWRRLPSLPPGRGGSVLLSDGVRLFVWGGARGGALLLPDAKRWTPFAGGPLGRVRDKAAAVWTGDSMIVYTAAGAAAYSPPVLAACGDDWMPENLRVTQVVKGALQVAARATRPPLAGHTYYGMYSGTSYALATFGRAPTVFRTDGHGVWHVRAETNGRICKTVVPVELLQVWSLRPVGAGCFVEPR